MGRKSTAKAKTAQSTPPADIPPPGKRSLTPLLALAIAIVVIAGAWYALSGRGEPQAQAPSTAVATTSTTPAAPADQANAVPANARFGPHEQATLPPLDWGPMPPARPPDVTRAVYTFAAEHPEILGYVPCYCGCERGGHRGNDDCFVAARAPNGDVTTWEPHGAT